MLDISIPKILYDGSTLPVPDEATHSAEELNDRIQENQNSVDDSGQTLDAADPGQLSKAMFTNGVAAQSMLATGTVNDVILTPITGVNGLRFATPAAPDYSLLDGAIFNFKSAGTNSGNMSVNVGQDAGTLIGAKDLFLEDGITEVPVGEVLSGTYYTVRYTSAGGGAFILITSPSTRFSVTSLVDSDAAAMVEDHAYLATSDGFVDVIGKGNDAQGLFAWRSDTAVGLVADANRVAANHARSTGDWASINFAVAEGEYFEVHADFSGASIVDPIIKWRSVGTLSVPVDQEP